MCCKGYWIVCEGLTGDYSIEQECTGTFHMHRTDMSEKQFICYSAPQTVTDEKVMSKEFDLILNEEGVDMVGGLVEIVFQGHVHEECWYVGGTGSHHGGAVLALWPAAGILQYSFHGAESPPYRLYHI